MDEDSNKKELREQAIRRLREKLPSQTASEKDASKLIEELSIHQEELNIQNEELQRVQVELEASRAKYFELYDLAPVGYITLTPELIIKESNLTASMLLGIDRKNLFNRGLSSFISPRSQESLYLHYRRLSQGKEKQVNTFLVRSKDGKELQIQFESNIVEEWLGLGFRSILTDVTEQVNARNKIEELSIKREEERHRLKTILDTLPVGVSLADEKGRITEINEASNRILGGKPPFVTSLGEYKQYKGWWADTGVPVRAENWPLAKALKEGKPVIGDVIDIERFDGTRGTIMISSAPILNGRKEIMGGVMVYQDITEQRELEHEAIEAKERAELYIDLLTHDINNMNTGIMGYLQLVMERGKLEKKEATPIEKSLDILKNSSHLIENVKKIQQIESSGARHGIIDLGWLLEDVVEEFKGHQGSEVTINYTIYLKRMVLASELLKDVFTNIIGNAIKHADGPVTINVQLSKTYEDGKEYYRVSIEDNGPGIPDEMKDKIFSRLQRGKTRASGVGLGLFLVRRLVEDYHGRAWVEDRVPGDHAQGAKFVVLLPVAS